MDYSDILQAVLITIIQVLLPIVLGMVAVWLRAAWQKAKGEISQQQYDMAVELAHQFVLAAEQNGLTGMIANVGEEKKRWALEQLDKALQARGIKLDLQMLSSMIESVVHEVFKL